MEKKIEICVPNQFELNHIFKCGQCFRWKKIEDNKYIGIIKNGVIKIEKEKNKLIIISNINENIEKICFEYFDLERDYGKIQKTLSKNDIEMSNAIEFGYGIRILKQDPWEMLISFILSAANNIPRISKMIENISEKYGEVSVFCGEKYYLFPTPQELNKASVEDLRKCNLGFRDKYVKKATEMVLNKEIELEKIYNLDYEESKKYLMKIPGVGAKVADCILLFAYGKFEAFPVDTWIKKVMQELYVESSNITKINDFARNKFGSNAGIAQQYLFYYKREN